MDDGSGASPARYGGDGSIRLVCDECSAANEYSPDDVDEGGFLSCRRCGAVYTDIQATATDADDVRITRRVTQPAPYPTPLYHPQHAPAFSGLDEPIDFVPWGEPEELGARVRRRYVQGLQLILQRQLEALVERHRVGVLVCGVAGTIWMRWVAASKVFDEMWARNVLAEDYALSQRPKGEQKPQEVKIKWEAEQALPRKDRRRVEFIFLRSLRTMLPLYSTLSCRPGSHPADRHLLVGNGGQLFRPVRVIGAWQLEAAAGSIARRIGLRLLSVNLYAIAQRYLNELSLPIERILPHACRIYEWAMPAEL